MTFVLFFRINDVAAKDENSFYVTNFASSITTIGYMFDIFLLRPLGNVVYCSYGKCLTAVDSLLSTNGVLFSADKK